MTNARTFIISGTDTGIGKTVVSAMLTLALEAVYWKPIQSGTEDGTDTQRVRTLTALPDHHFLPERAILSQPLSPHRGAELDHTPLDLATFQPPQQACPLLIEGAGGLLVPLTRHKLQIDLFAEWKAPVILCARTGLGTINHTLLSIEALHHRNIPLHGLIFVGENNADNIQTIAAFSGARILGHLPPLPHLTSASLLTAFAEGFQKKDFK